MKNSLSRYAKLNWRYLKEKNLKERIRAEKDNHCQSDRVLSILEQRGDEVDEDKSRTRLRVEALARGYRAGFLGGGSFPFGGAY